jgi:hypothetical protein
MRPSPHSVLTIACAVALIAHGSVKAQQTQAPPPPVDPDGHGPVGESCSGDGHRAFDFWLGEWTVENADGATVGSNTITRISNGCAVLEHWIGGSGVPGQSLNHYDAAAGTWHQRWVGGNGQILDLTGGLEGESMVLSGERDGQDGPVLDRITWSPLEDGSVRQKWDVSRDAGETWQEVFLGLYRHTD